MVVNIRGDKTHELVDNALRVLENMSHRGAEGADGKSGDGAGIMVQIPHEFILLQGIPVPEKGRYGTGLVFLPKETAKRECILDCIKNEVEHEGCVLSHVREVPVNSACLGEEAAKGEPFTVQIFVTSAEFIEEVDFERKLYTSASTSKGWGRTVISAPCPRAISYIKGCSPAVSCGSTMPT